MEEEIKTYRLTWHGPVGDEEFDVDAFDEDDAKHTLAAWLNGGHWLKFCRAGKNVYGFSRLNGTSILIL